jgi:hypothetical protein
MPQELQVEQFKNLLPLEIQVQEHFELKQRDFHLSEIK